jgi:dTDP-4-dehydrorhamnose 3,5-epimerase
VEFREFDIEGPLELLPTKHGDERGYFSEILRMEPFVARAGAVEFVQDNQSLSVSPGTIRGVHFQSQPRAQGKLVRCTAGSVFDVAVDLRLDSPTYGKWISVVLAADKLNQLWIPVGFGHAFCTLEPNSAITYRVTNYYSPEHDLGLLWNDPQMGIEWPDVANPETLSAKDRAQPTLTNLPPLFSIRGQSCG